MESFKHSCPFCGQHIEYTAEYCGKQVQCPQCRQTVTFPAVPPGRSGPALGVKSLGHQPGQKRVQQAAGAFALLRHFQHWNVVAQCAVPFLVIGLLLAGAAFVKKKLADAPAPAAFPAVQADPQAWQRSTDLNKAELAVKNLMKELAVAHAYADAADQARRQAEHGDQARRLSADEQVERAQNALIAARLRFNAAMSNYRQLGGTIDYGSQVRN
jgi:hypothetical protein